MQYADLQIGQVIQNLITEEVAVIKTRVDGAVRVVVQTGPDAGLPFDLPPSEVLTFWKVVDGS